MQKCLFKIFLLTLLTGTPLFAELSGYPIPKNDRTYLGQTSDFFCPVPSDSSFRILLGINGGLNGFYSEYIIINVPSVAEINLFMIFRLIGRHQIQIDGGYYGFFDWENKVNIGINYIYDFSIPLLGITYIAISPGFHFLGVNKSKPPVLIKGDEYSVYDADLDTDVDYRTHLNSILSYQLKVRISKLFKIIEPFFSFSIYHHRGNFIQEGYYHVEDEWKHKEISKNANYKSTDLAIHTGFSLIGRRTPLFQNLSIGINPGYTKPIIHILSPVSLSVGYRFRTH